MKNFGLMFTAIAGLTAVSLLVTWGYGLKLGIDLSGGTILVYQVREGQRAENYRIDDLISALKKRINPEGLSDIPIRKIGSNRVEIILAKASPEQVEDLKRKITEVGSLEFRILATEKKDGERGRNAVARAMAANGLKSPPAGYRWALFGQTITGKVAESTSSTIRAAGVSWPRDRFANPNWTDRPEDASHTHIVLTGKDSAGLEHTGRFAIASNTKDTIALVRPHAYKTITSFTIHFNPSGITPSDEAIVREQPRGDGVVDRYVLYQVDRYNVTGEFLSRTFPTQDERIQPAVGFHFNAAGARKFGNLTREHLPEEGGSFKYRLAIILDGLVMTAPNLNAEIREAGIIEGVQPKEVPFLVEILQSGSLPASIDPVPLLEETIGPTLGQDTIDKGLWAIGISMAVVPLFMIVYYRFAGAVAVFALVLNMIMLVASMAFTSSSFTLPGLAGLALTIGMAVDANVLIFERMREEAERGASMAQQIRNGFSRAWMTIFDSHVTALLSGVVLWAVGTEEIKGFALTLIIGMGWNLFTAVFVSRIVFEFWYDRGWLKRINMMKIMDKTAIDFIGPRKYLISASVVVITLGLIAFYVNRQRMFNIDFTGGTLVTIQVDNNAEPIKKLSEGARAAYVRTKASEVLPDPSVETLNVTGEERGVRFNIRTTDEKVDQVRRNIVKAFGPVLARPRITVTNPVTVAGSRPTVAEKAKASEAAEARFAGGHRYEMTIDRRIDLATVRNAFAAVLKAVGVANPETRFAVVALPSSTEKETHLALETDLPPAEASKHLASFTESLVARPELLFERSENFGGAVAGETRNLAIAAIVASWLIIIVYVWLRFKSMSYGLAAVIALIHDVLITLGAVAISPYKIDLPMVAAFLTLIGFSVNDTIVIFDRIREIKGKSPYLTAELINAAVNQTMSRTILTSLTAWLVVVILYLFGGEGLQGFSFCLVVGFLSGTYSTIYIASPILIDWMGGSKREPVKGKTLVGAP
jgi:SecD/SecF fusion protein